MSWLELVAIVALLKQSSCWSLQWTYGSREDKISPHHMALLKPWWLEKNTLKKRTPFFWNSKTWNSPTPIFIVTLKTKECISNSTEWFFGIPIVRHFNYSFGVAQTESRWSGQQSSRPAASDEDPKIQKIQIQIDRNFNYSFGVARTESRWSDQESSS